MENDTKSENKMEIGKVRETDFLPFGILYKTEFLTDSQEKRVISFS